MNTSQPAVASHELNQQLTSVTRVIVAAKDTVGALDPSMPQVAATPYLVTVAEFACANLIKHLLEPGQITVGTRVVIDHLGASKVGAELVVKAAVVNREKNRFRFAVEIEDGARTVAKVEHERAVVSLEKLMKALG
jgi:fluoroacetyl-CoA thioesterase